MRNLLLVVAAIAAAWIVIRVWPAPDDRERIRLLLLGAAAEASAGGVGDVLDCFEPGFCDQPSGIDREQLRVALLQAVMRRRGGRAVEVALDEPGLRVEVDGDAAIAAFRLLLSEGPTGARRVTFEAEVEAVLARGGDGAWRIASSRHRALRGSLPGGR